MRSSDSLSEGIHSLCAVYLSHRRYKFACNGRLSLSLEFSPLKTSQIAVASALYENFECRVSLSETESQMRRATIYLQKKHNHNHHFVFLAAVKHQNFYASGLRNSLIVRACDLRSIEHLDVQRER